MLNIKKRSKWEFETSAGLGSGFSVGEILAIGAGKSSFTAVAPEGDKTKFHYISAGIGAGVGAKVSIAGSEEDFLSVGRIYILDSFKGDELKYSDFTGTCLIAEASAGIIHGGAGTVLLLGIPTTSLIKKAIKAATGLAGMIAFGRSSSLLHSAKAMVMIAGLNKGPQISAGVLGSIGRVWAEVLPEPPPTIDMPLPPVEVSTRSSSHAKVILAGDVLFDFDKDILGTKAHPEHAVTALNRAGSILQYVKDIPEAQVRVEGHTDSVGSASYNQALSVRRAANVGQWLIRNGYVPAKQISWTGYGETRPTASNATAEGRAKNRRVEIFVEA